MADFTIGDYQYTIRSGKAYAQVVSKTKTSYADMTSTVTYNGNTYDVELGYGNASNGCFSGCSNLLQAPKLADLATHMEGCFNNCTSLTTPPIIPNSVTNMYTCFNSCTNLTTPPIIPNSVTDMGYCFYYCTNLTTPPTIPNSVTDMYNCFNHCTNLTTAPAIPNSVTNMESCFEDCINLTTAPAIPNSIITIDYCFWDCINLTGDIFVFGAPTTYSAIFSNEENSKPITIRTANTTILPTWETIANQYSNVTAIYDPSLTHIGDKINLKSLLTKVLQQLKTLSDKLAIFKSAEEKVQESSNQTSYQTWRYASNFGSNLTGTTSDSNYLTVGNDGITCHKSGFYLLNASGHCNCTGGTSISIRWYNATTAVAIGDPRYFYDKSLTWMPFNITSYGYINENDIVAFQMQKYSPNNTTAGFRPSSLMVSYIYLGDDGVGKRANVGFSLTASTVNITDKFGIRFHLETNSNMLIVNCLNNYNIKITSASHSAFPNMTFTYVPGQKGVPAYIVGTNTSTISSIAGTLTLSYEPK